MKFIYLAIFVCASVLTGCADHPGYRIEPRGGGEVGPSKGTKEKVSCSIHYLISNSISKPYLAKKITVDAVPQNSTDPDFIRIDWEDEHRYVRIQFNKEDNSNSFFMYTSLGAIDKGQKLPGFSQYMVLVDNLININVSIEPITIGPVEYDRMGLSCSSFSPKPK